MNHKMIHALEHLVFSHRKVILAICAALTVVLGYQTSQLRFDAEFQKRLPRNHPYVQVFLEYHEEFGAANRILVAVRAREGEIFNVELFEAIKQVTDELFLIREVNRSSIRSIFTPNVRFVEIVEVGLLAET